MKVKFTKAIRHANEAIHAFNYQVVQTLTLATISKLSWRADTFKAVDFIFTSCTTAARRRVTFVDVDFTIWSRKSGRAWAEDPALTIDARAFIVARIGCTVVDI